MTAPSHYAACGKFILLGEHFVVHGAPAVALPLDAVSTRVTVRSLEGRSSLQSGLVGEARALSERLVAAAVERLATGPVSASVDSTIPVGFGLGSSAAFCVSLVGALAGLRPRPVPMMSVETVREHAHALERLVHGAPSGIDDSVIAHRAPVLFRRGDPLRFLSLGGPVELVLGSCGYPGSTFEAVAGVRAFKEADEGRFDSLARSARSCVAGGVAALADGDRVALGSMLDANHELLCAVGVSTPDLDRLVTAARNAGALGAKLTGGGLGGFVLALSDGSAGAAAGLSAAMEAAGATRTMVTRVEPSTPDPRGAQER